MAVRGFQQIPDVAPDEQPYKALFKLLMRPGIRIKSVNNWACNIVNKGPVNAMGLLH